MGAERHRALPVIGQRRSDLVGPGALADPQATVTADDVATVVAFGGNSIGIMWTDQAAAHEGFWLSIHHDGAATGAWSAAEAAYTGALTADDHVNAKASSNGHLYAVVKTSMNTGTNPQVVLLDRAPNGSGPGTRCGWATTT